MLRHLIFAVFLSLLCHQSCVGRPINTVGIPRELGWQAWLLVDSDTPKPNNEEGKKRRITPKSVFIAPAFSGTSPLPDCAEGYRADSMGRCVKLVQLNHAAQLDFLLQRLNAMYAAPIIRRDNQNKSTSDSNSTGPLQVTIPIDIPPEPEEETEESVEVAVVMADVLKDDQVKNVNKKVEAEKSQTIVAVWNVGKNGSSLEEIESASDLEIHSDNLHLENSDFMLTTSNTTKYEIINESDHSTTPKTQISLMNDEQLLSTAPTSLLLPEDSSETLPESIKGPGSAMELLEEVGNISSEDWRLGNTSRRNVSSGQGAETTETTPTTETVVNSTGTKHDRNASSVPQAEVQVTSETKTIVLSTSTYRPSTFVRFPTEKSANKNIALTDKNFIKFPETHYDHSSPGPLLPSDVHERQTFWWLPPGWKLDPTRHQPMLIRFWARMPLLRDHHSGVSGVTDSAARKRGSLVY